MAEQRCPFLVRGLLRAASRYSKISRNQGSLIYQNISLYKLGYGYQIYILPSIVLLMT